LVARLAQWLESARQQRAPLALALFEVERFTDVVFQLGAGGAREALQLLTTAIAEWAGPAAHTALLSDSRVALIVGGGSRQESVQLARQILTSVRPWSREHLPLSFELTFSAGLAALEAPPLNYPAGEMLSAAQRCLMAAQLSGGNTVKSIDL
jgi:PleD family two-component response regulator